MLGASLLFAIDLTILYAAGSYVMGRLMKISGFGGGRTVLSRMVFYLLVFPGVVLHEGAHYLACLLTGTRVVRFAPFSPRTSADGRGENGAPSLSGRSSGWYPSSCILWGLLPSARCSRRSPSKRSVTHPLGLRKRKF